MRSLLAVRRLTVILSDSAFRSTKGFEVFHTTVHHQRPRMTVLRDAVQAGSDVDGSDIYSHVKCYMTLTGFFQPHAFLVPQPAVKLKCFVHVAS